MIMTKHLTLFYACKVHTIRAIHHRNHYNDSLPECIIHVCSTCLKLKEAIVPRNTLSNQHEYNLSPCKTRNNKGASIILASVTLSPSSSLHHEGCLSQGENNSYQIFFLILRYSGMLVNPKLLFCFFSFTFGGVCFKF